MQKHLDLLRQAQENARVKKWLLSMRIVDKPEWNRTFRDTNIQVKMKTDGVYLAGGLTIDQPEIKYKIKQIGGDLVLSNPNLTSLKNAPEVVKGNFTLAAFDVPLDGFPRCIGGNLTCLNLKSLQGIHKHVDSIEGTVEVECLERGLLGVMLVPGVRRVHVPCKLNITMTSSFYAQGRFPGAQVNEEAKSPRLLAAAKIINKHLLGEVGVSWYYLPSFVKPEKPTKRAILAAQQELLDTGLEEFAEF